MTKTLEEILTKLEKDFSELKKYAIKLEAENCMLRKELEKKAEDISDNCEITLEEALYSAYVEKNKQQFKSYLNRILFYISRFNINRDNLYISSFYGERLSKYDTLTSSCLAIFAVILLHYGIDIKIDIISDGRKYLFNDLFEKYKNEIKFRPIKS